MWRPVVNDSALLEVHCKYRGANVASCRNIE